MYNIIASVSFVFTEARVNNARVSMNVPVLEVGLRNGEQKGPTFTNVLLCSRYYVWGFYIHVSIMTETAAILYNALRTWDAEMLSNFPKIMQ